MTDANNKAPAGEGGELSAASAFDLGHKYMLEIRGIDDPCSFCSGSGVRVYGSTSTWRGGIGGSAMTQDVCDRCWGTGDSRRKGCDLRAFTSRRREWEAVQCAQWLANRIGANFKSSQANLSLLADVIAREANKRKPAGIGDGDRFWYARQAESLAAAIRELVTPKEPTP